MRVIPEDHLRNFLRKPFRDKPAQKALRSLSVDDTCPRSRPISLSEPSRSLRRKPLEISVETPFRTILREVPPVPEASPEGISPKASFDTPSKQTLRFFLRNMPRVPKVKPKDPFEIGLMFRSPAKSHPLRKLLQNLLRSYLRKVPRVPECRAKSLPARILSEPTACPRMPQTGRIPPVATRARHL